MPCLACPLSLSGKRNKCVRVQICVEVLESLKLGPFRVKLNHRKLLDALLGACGNKDEANRPTNETHFHSTKSTPLSCRR